MSIDTSRNLARSLVIGCLYIDRNIIGLGQFTNNGRTNGIGRQGGSKGNLASLAKLSSVDDSRWSTIDSKKLSILDIGLAGEVIGIITCMVPDFDYTIFITRNR